MTTPETLDYNKLLERCWDSMVSSPIDAEKLASEAIQTSDIESAPYVKAVCYRGLCLHYLGKYDEAIEALSNALSMAISNDQKQNIRRTHNALGMCFHAMGHYDTAIEHYDRCADIARKDNNILTLAPPLINLSTLLFDVGDLDSAEQILNEVLGQDLTHMVKDNLVELYLVQAQVLLVQGSLEDAHKSIDVAFAMAEEMGFTIGKLRCNIVRGRLYRLQANITLSCQYLTSVITDPELSNVGADAVYTYVELAKNHYAGENYEKGIATLRDGLKRIVLPDFAPHRLAVYDNLVEGYGCVGDIENELYYLKQCQTIERSSQSQNSQNLLGAREIKRQYDEERVNQQVAAREHDLLKESYRRLSLVNGIAHQIAMTLDFKVLGERLFEILNDHLDVHFISLSTVTRDQQDLEFQFIFDSGKFLKGDKISLANINSKSVRALLLGRPVVVDDAGPGVPPGFIGDSKTIPRSLLFVPLILEKRVLGVFSMQSTIANRFKDYERHLMVAICKFIAIAVSNILSHEEVKQLNKSLVEEKRAIESAQKRIEHMAYHDSLTSLPNRQGLEEFVERRITDQQRPFHLVYIDLDAFKPINDKYGHRVGDQVLIEIADRVKNALRARDFAARIGGDEFVLVVDEFGSKSDLNNFLQRLLQTIEVSVVITEGSVSVSASIGTARFPERGKTLDALMHSADREMYSVKRSGKGGVKTLY